MKLTLLSFLCLLLVLAPIFPGRLAAEVIKEDDRIGWSADGNQHDPDDWGATAMALAIFAKQGWQNKLVHIDYNNWLPDNTPLKAAHETISVREGVQKFRFVQTKVFDCQTDLEAAIDNVVAEINKSSSDSRFWYCQAGPFEVAYLALKKADPEKRQYCILVSHSSANERPEHWPGQHGKDDCVALGAKYFFTEKQGKKKFGGGKFYEWQLVDWMKNSPCPEYRWVYFRLRATAEYKHEVLDASDGGIAFVLATGDTESNFSPKLRDFLGTDWPKPALADASRVFTSPHGAFVEENGIVVIEMENTELPPDWKLSQEVSGYLGIGYIQYTGGKVGGGPGVDRIVYPVKISTPGTYAFQWRCKNGPDARENAHDNDTWLNIEANEFFVMKDGEKYDLEEGHFLKVWVHSVGAWMWQAKGEIFPPGGKVNGVDLFATFKKPGVYNITISGRSNGHSIDRMALWHSTANAEEAMSSTTASSKQTE